MEYLLILFLCCGSTYLIFNLLVEILKQMKPKKNKSDPTEFLKFDNLIAKINNEYPKFENILNWKEEALELISINLGEKDEIYTKLNTLEIQNLQDIVEFKKLIEEAKDKHLKNEIKRSLEVKKNVSDESRDQHLKNEIKKSFEEMKNVSGEAEDKHSKNDINISERVRSNIWSEYQGSMTWYEANAKARELGMKLPTLAELETAYDAKVTKSWKVNGRYYWTSKEFPADRAYYFNIDNGNSDTNEIYHEFKHYKHHVRCIRY